MEIINIFFLMKAKKKKLKFPGMSPVCIPGMSRYVITSTIPRYVPGMPPVWSRCVPGMCTLKLVIRVMDLKKGREKVSASKMQEL